MSPAVDAVWLSRIEDAALNASAPPQQWWLDGWLLRLSPGKAKRARCIHALASGLLPVAARLEQARDVYRQAGLPLIVRLTPFSQPEGLDATLAALGLQRFGDSLVMVGRVAAMDLAASLPGTFSLQAAAPADYARIVAALRGSPPGQQEAHAERLMQSPVPYRGLVLRRDGEVLACGQSAREGDRVGLYDVVTAAPARNQGLSRLLCAELLRRAAGEGATTAYLQVDADNAPALALYRRLGFASGYPYHYHAADPARA